MKILKISFLVIALALLGSTFTVDAKVKKRRSTSKKERTIKKKNTSKNMTSSVEKCGLDMVEYQHQGMMMQPVAEVRLERKNGKVVMAVRGTTTQEQEFVLDDGEQLLKEALTIIEEEKMLDYGVSYDVPPEMQPLDGYAWSFSARLADGRKISTHGHNAEPGGNGLNKINSLLFTRARKLLGLSY